MVTLSNPFNATEKRSSFNFAVLASTTLLALTDILQVNGQPLRDTNYISDSNHSLPVNLTHEFRRSYLNMKASNECKTSLNNSFASPASCHLRAVCYFGNPAENSKVSGLDIEADTYLVTADFDPETNSSIHPTRVITVDDHALKQWWEAGNVSVGDLHKHFGLSNAWSGLPHFRHGGGAYIQRDISECLRSIRATEIDRGFDYKTIAFSRRDLHWVCNGDDSVPGINECIVPCPNNDWGGVCDQHALCGRNAARAYANVRSATVLFVSNALPQHRVNRGHELNSERFLRWRLETQGVKIRRAPDAFVRACRSPKNGEEVGDAHHKCEESKKLGFWAKKSGDQPEHTLQACGLMDESPNKSPANNAKSSAHPTAKSTSKLAAKPAKPAKPGSEKPGAKVVAKPARPLAKPKKDAAKAAAKLMPKLA